MTQKTAIIIGGGIAGLTFARCLTTKDYEIHIFEKKEQFGEIGAAISVFPNALCVMDKLGLLKTILEKMVFPIPWPHWIGPRPVSL